MLRKKGQIRPDLQVWHGRGFYETAGGVKVFLLLFFPHWKFLPLLLLLLLFLLLFLLLPLLLPLSSCFRFISGFYTHSF